MSPPSRDAEGEWRAVAEAGGGVVVLHDAPLEQRRDRRRVGLKDDVFVVHRVCCRWVGEGVSSERVDYGSDEQEGYRGGGDRRP